MGKNKRRVVLLVTPQTAYNLQRLADMDKTSPRQGGGQSGAGQDD